MSHFQASLCSLASAISSICCRLFLPQRQEVLSSKPLLAPACHLDWRLSWNFVNSFGFCLTALEATETLCRNVGSKLWIPILNGKPRECSNVSRFVDEARRRGGRRRPRFAMCNVAAPSDHASAYHAWSRANSRLGYSRPRAWSLDVVHGRRVSNMTGARRFDSPHFRRQRKL